MPRASLFAVVLGALVWIAAFGTALGRWLDESVALGLLRIGSTRLQPVLEAIVHVGDPLPYAVGGMVLAGVAVGRGRRRTAWVVGAILLGSAVTTQLLKLVVAVPDTLKVLPGAEWPSGHTTAAVALALCLVLVVPGRWRPVAAALGGATAAAVGLSTVALGWHYPSDVLGGVAVASAWAYCLARGAIRPSLAAPAPSVALAGTVGLVLLAAVAARPAATLEFATDYTAAAVLSPLLALTALAAAAAMAAATAERR